MNRLIAALRELVLLVRLANATLCARYCAWAIDRAREDLHRALLAADECRGALNHIEHSREPGLPTYLLRR